jgi:hypothetical protein
MKPADNFDLKKFITEGRLIKEDQTIFEKRIQRYIKNGSQGNLDFHETDITSLPDNLKVGGDLILDDTPITSLPKGLEVEGDLSISNTKITTLPDNLKIGHRLSLDDTPITSLPKGLEVGWSLSLSGTKITSLPSDLKVGSHVAFWPGHPIFEKYTKDQIKKMVPGIKGNIF